MISAGSLLTTWRIRTYDVVGDCKDGYEVSDVNSIGEIELHIPQTRYSAGTPQEFVGAYPNDTQIKLAFGINCPIDANGDDLRIYVEREHDGYPIGEMICTSHASLVPVRKLVA
jgi:hypothetical protein